jgi:hypothetical protein
MAKKGKSYGGYGASVQSSILQNIIRGQSGMASGAATTGATGSTPKAASTVAKPRRQQNIKEQMAAEAKTEAWKTMSPEERKIAFADDPVLSGKYTDPSKLVDSVYKYVSALNLAPSATDTGKTYTNKLAKYNEALTSLGPDVREQYHSFFRLGGSIGDLQIGPNTFKGGGPSSTNILKYLETGQASYSPDLVINQVPGQSKDYPNQTVLAGMNKATGQMNLSQNKLGKLRELKGIKQAGGTLSAKQKAKLQRLRDLKNT